MSTQKMSISVALCAAAVLTNNPVFAGDKDVNVVNTPDVNVANTPDVNVINMPDVVVANDAEQPVPVYVKSTPATDGDFRRISVLNDGVGLHSLPAFEAEEPATLVEAFQLGGINASDASLCSTTGSNSCWCQPQLVAKVNIASGFLFKRFSGLALFSGKSDSIYVQLPRPMLVSPGSVDLGAITNVFLEVAIIGHSAAIDEYCSASVTLFTSPVE